MKELSRSKQPIEWEEFISQHDGLQLIIEYYSLSHKEVKDAMVKSISNLVKLKQNSKGLGEQL